jgi:hypothetical protein
MLLKSSSTTSPGVYYQLLMLASFILAGYQDAKERLVSDLYWIPGILAAVLAVVFVPSMDFVLVARITLIGVIAFAFSWFGYIGEADAIALALVASDPTPYAPIPVLLATGVIALAHIGYLYINGTARKSRLITMAEFTSQPKWIPKALIVDGVRRELTNDVNVSRELAEENAKSTQKGPHEEGKEGVGADDPPSTTTTMVEVQYGVPQVTYIAAGFVAYIIFLAIFHPSFLTAVP